MRLSVLIFSLSCHHVLQLVLTDEITLTRHADGDVFTIPGSCNEACMVLSSDTASPFGSATSSFTGKINDSCTCQCNYGLPVFREDLRICVNNIQECDVAGFVSSSGLVEKVPYVFLPQYGQLIYPHAEIRFQGVESPVCVITGVQQLGKSGWSDLRNISDVEFPLSLYRDEERTFLQWIGEAKLREAAEGKIVVVKLTCRDSYPSAVYRGVFTPCVAFRVAGSPSKATIKEVLFSTSPPNPQGLTSTEYTAIGVSSVLLALIYIASVSLYLHSRKSRRKDKEDREPESGQRNSVNNADAPGLVKCNPLLSVSRHFESSDTNSAVSEADHADKLLQSESESEVENVRSKLVTSAIIHPHEDYFEQQEQNCNSGPIIGERLPEEDVRVVETTENASLHHMPVFPGTQRRKLYFNPAYFERQLLSAPPPAAVEFLLKIREVISIAKHKMAMKRFVPTLNEIPEESSLDRQSVATQQPSRRRSNSVHNGIVVGPSNGRKSLRCTGCPGCSHGSSTPNLSTSRNLVENSAISGESRVRAWLEDVKLLDARWRNLEEDQRQQKQLVISNNKAKETRDVDTESTRMSTKSLPPIFNEASEKRLNGCINEVFEDDTYGHIYSPKRYTKSVTREPGFLERQADEIAEWSRRNTREHEDIPMNVNVRQSIENSFKNQLDHLQKTGTNDNSSTNNQEIVSRSIRNLTPENIQNMNEKNNDKIMNKKTNVMQQNDSNRTKGIVETRVLLDIINDELSVRSCSDAKRIMDAVIQELVVAKEREKELLTSTKVSDYETDSLEKTKVSRKSSSSPDYTDKSSPALSTALPMEEELTMRNAIIDVQISEITSNKSTTTVKNHNLPEVVPIRPENYALVSEVYVNDGYASPAGSDEDSGPEIQYESENPGHLTIKVVDSPKNYVKQDESEYEPDTLDRKPMKLKINGDVTYEKDIVNEVYVDSLERSSQILLRSKKSFREENSGSDTPTKPPREYNSLREIYEARLKYQQQQQQQQQKQQLLLLQDDINAEKEDKKDQSDIWREKNCKCTSPLLPRHERRQRKADNQPDVVPKPPPPEIQTIANPDTKNVQDRSLAIAGDPTTRKDSPVFEKDLSPVVGKPPAVSRKSFNTAGSNDKTTIKTSTVSSGDREANARSDENRNKTDNLKESTERKDEQNQQQFRRFAKWRNNPSTDCHSSRSPSHCSKSSNKSQQKKSTRTLSKRRYRVGDSSDEKFIEVSIPNANLEDSAYVSSPESNNSRRHLLEQRRDENNSCSCTESDESTSGNGGANSESGAESIETDSVFFGNFRPDRERLAALECGKKSQNRSGNDTYELPVNYQDFKIKSRVY